jgi:hypothetical protein
MIQGVVAAKEASNRLSVYLSAATTPVGGIRYLDSFMPEVGDVVWIAKTGPDLIAIGRLHAETFPIPHFVDEQVTTAGGSTTSASFVNLSVRCRVVGFEKVRADTDIVVHYLGSVYNDNSLGEAEVAVNFNGGDTTLARGFSTAGVLHGGASFGDVPKGTYDLELRKRRVNGTGNVIDGVTNSKNYMIVWETYQTFL